MPPGRWGPAAGDLCGAPAQSVALQPTAPVLGLARQAGTYVVMHFDSELSTVSQIGGLTDEAVNACLQKGGTSPPSPPGARCTVSCDHACVLPSWVRPWILHTLRSAVFEVVSLVRLSRSAVGWAWPENAAPAWSLHSPCVQSESSVAKTCALCAT